MIYHRNGIPIEKCNPDMLILARESRELAKWEIAHGTGMDIHLIEQFERGSKQPTVEQITRIADMLRYPVAFFYRDGQKLPAEPCTRYDDVFEELPEQLPLL